MKGYITFFSLLFKHFTFTVNPSLILSIVHFILVVRTILIKLSIFQDSVYVYCSNINIASHQIKSYVRPIFNTANYSQKVLYKSVIHPTVCMYGNMYLIGLAVNILNGQ